MQNTARRPKITVSADGKGIVSQAGGLLLAETLRVTGLGEGLTEGLARWRAPRAVHDPGKIIVDLVTALALGGDCLADIGVLRSQPDLAGPVASDPVVSRLVTALAADAPRALRAIRKARAAARERAWSLAGDRAPGGDGSLIPVDIDATIVIAHSEKEKTTPTWKKTFGFHPLTVFADHGAAAAGEALAIILRPGNAGSNTAAEHIEVTRLALAQLPRRQRGQLADLELRHRRRARCEDRIRCAKDTGLRNLPLHGFDQNQIWCELVAMACELTAWVAMLALDGPARAWEPKRLRLRLFSAAGRLVRGGRRLRLRIAATWPWATHITAAISRLQALAPG